MASFLQTAGASFALACALCATGSVRAAQPDSAPAGVDQAVSQQERIYRTHGTTQPRGYVTDRGLHDYLQALPAGFASTLKALRRTDRWLDVGAGSGQAILDYYLPDAVERPERAGAEALAKAMAVALSIEDRRGPQWHRLAPVLRKTRYLAGKRLRDYSADELGSFRLVTDVYGGFSYTDDLSRFVGKVLELLAVGGEFYTLVQSVHLEDGSESRSTWFLTRLLDHGERIVTVCAWMKNIACAQTVCESRSDWHTPTELLHVRKTCDAVSVPALDLLSYEPGVPPARTFRIDRF